ncbi:MAG: HPr family phosphocarrier protein, partial [Opitutaceae bacterium]|nr:HPr family phosphocarrier protein [Opitutaceae bacterium]
MTTLEHRFACPLPNGLHARPASHLEAVASRFAASAVLVNERTGAEANAKSVLALIGADIHAADPLLLRVSGADADAAFTALVKFLRDDFAATDAPLPPAAPIATATLPLPRSLRAAAPERVLRGAIACRGLAEGVIVTVGSLQLSDLLQRRLASAAAPDDGGLPAFHRAVAAVQSALAAEIAAARGPQADVLRAHASLLGDVSLADSVARHLARQPGPLASAILAAIAEFSDTLRASTNTYLQERVLDLQDVGARLLTQLYGTDAVARGPRLEAPSLVVAESLTPGQFLALDRAHLRGLVLQHAGATSHTVILARSFGLPTLTGVADADALAPGTPALLDAHLGLLLPSPNDAVRRYYAMEFRRLERARAATLAFREPPGASRDGRRLPVLANVSSAEEVAAAVAQGAEGVGLFRTEMLYMDRDEPPS